jgi:hypothetical protein
MVIIILLICAFTVEFRGFLAAIQGIALQNGSFLPARGGLPLPKAEYACADKSAKGFSGRSDTAK